MTIYLEAFLFTMTKITPVIYALKKPQKNWLDMDSSTVSQSD